MHLVALVNTLSLMLSSKAPVLFASMDKFLCGEFGILPMWNRTVPTLFTNNCPLLDMAEAADDPETGGDHEQQE